MAKCDRQDRCSLAESLPRDDETRKDLHMCGVVNAQCADDPLLGSPEARVHSAGVENVMVLPCAQMLSHDLAWHKQIG